MIHTCMVFLFRHNVNVHWSANGICCVIIVWTIQIWRWLKTVRRSRNRRVRESTILLYIGFKSTKHAKNSFDIIPINKLLRLETALTSPALPRVCQWVQSGQHLSPSSPKYPHSQLHIQQLVFDSSHPVIELYSMKWKKGMRAEFR